jgi:hypothetical protein
MTDVPPSGGGRALDAVRILVRLLLTVFFVAVAAQGFLNVSQNLGDLQTGAQQLMTATQAGYSLFALLCAMAAWRPSGRTMLYALAFSVTVTVSVGLIPAAWIPDEADSWPDFAGPAALGAGLVVLLLAWAKR